MSDTGRSSRVGRWPTRFMRDAGLIALLLVPEATVTGRL